MVMIKALFPVSPPLPAYFLTNIILLSPMVVTSCQLISLHDAGQAAVAVLGHKDVEQQACAGDC